MRSIHALLVLAAACGGGGGGDDGDDAPGDGNPRLIAGGGVADAPIDGTLHVHVVEVDSATPIANASVRVESGSTVLVAPTAASGLVTFTGIADKQTVTVTAPGHAAATWIGVAGANVTIPLEPSPRTIPMARVTGTIAGWSGLPDPPLGNYLLGVVLYSFLEDPTAPENSIPQPMSGTTPANTCFRSAVADSCAWQLNARVGKQVLTAVIVEGDPNGTTSDPSDDDYVLRGYAVSEPLMLTAGQQMTNVSLQMITATMPFTAALPAAPGGLSYVAAIPELELDDGTGRIVFPLPTLDRTMSSKQVLAPTGRFAGKYQLVALATPSPTATTPFSSAFVHDVSGTAMVGSWLAPPAQVTAGATFSFGAPSGAGFHTAQLSRNRTPLWNVTVLDGSTSFQLPALTPDPLGSGSATFAVTSAEVPSFDAKKFDIPAVKASLVRASGASATFTR